MTDTLFDPYEDDPPPALGIVLDVDRGSLPYALIHGEALVACAAWALGEAGVTPLDNGITWDAVRRADEPVVLHDALCPMTPADFIASCVGRALAEDVIVVGTRPVTDTIKRIADGLVGETVDREGLISIVSPVVLPPSVVSMLADEPGTDLVALVASLATTHRVVLVEAPASARRVTSAEEIAVLEALTAG
ncbi:2-C-methyl-D-erythritol 4-phosphate cytidylyltransferase [Nocardioides sp.]|uniref:2-C-methyl-D-erythritol 4-phosphate cytidylyltransferase n=1 Tax=Nocardioides sp. TaxID=35761 RepID=UPI00286E7AB5|nr:2-C-methyl-D-erythritol 4-phosphate cytidylyltransferase [Nocardioides sp.]